VGGFVNSQLNGSLQLFFELLNSAFYLSKFVVK